MKKRVKLGSSVGALISWISDAVSWLGLKNSQAKLDGFDYFLFSSLESVELQRIREDTVE